MPSSRPDHLSALAYLIEQVNPQSILDLGIGSGFKGAFFREYTDVWNHGIIDRKDAIKLHGVEIFAEYRNPLWDLYDHITIGDAVKAIQTVAPQSYDMVHCGDVIEHVSQAEGETLIYQVTRVAKKCAVIVTPVRVRKQGTVFGNPYERHVSEWGPKWFPYHDGWDSLSFGNVGMHVWRPERS